MPPVIKVENLSKQYRLGDVGTGTLRDDFKRWRYRLMGKEDPFLKIGEENDRRKVSESDYVWALKDINFEVEQGDVVGIIGRNGAGKSTLLKILSRTTAPTTGSVKVKGRIASLLEVGTGFHGELSGRENIYLNGAIMGLRKWEIDKKLDEIIDFAGVEKYLDTPVKRYSSGMYVRLAFAVAAYLEPDILIVDEVLAVGDAEFQEKCLGKMKDVSDKDGRTVLFVSHNLGTIMKLCPNTILMNNGLIDKFGKSSSIVENYYNKNSSEVFIGDNKKNHIYIKELYTCNKQGSHVTSFSHSDEIRLRIKIGINQFDPIQNIGIGLLMNNKSRVFTVNKSLSNFYKNNDKEIIVDFIIRANLIAPMDYSFLVALNTRTGIIYYDVHEDVCSFKVYDNGTDFDFAEGKNYGCIILDDKWDLVSNK